MPKTDSAAEAAWLAWKGDCMTRPPKQSFMAGWRAAQGTLDRTEAEAEAERMWPQGAHLGRWDGVSIDGERALLLQRQAFVMGAEWRSDHQPHGREHDMSKSQYGEWEARGEKVDVAVYEVASVHHLHGTQCLCGFESHRARSRTEHIIDVTLAALAHARVLPRTDEERNGPELTAYLRSFTDPGSIAQESGDA